MDNQLAAVGLDKTPIEAVQPAREAIKFRMPEMRIPGLTIFEWDVETDALVPMVPLQKNIIASGHSSDAIKEQQTLVQHKFKGRLNCVYVQALNLRNAQKKIDKLKKQE